MISSDQDINVFWAEVDNYLYEDNKVKVKELLKSKLSELRVEYKEEIYKIIPYIQHSIDYYKKLSDYFEIEDAQYEIEEIAKKYFAQSDPNLYLLRYNKGLNFFFMGNFSKAIENIEDVKSFYKDLNPNDTMYASCSFLLGKCYYSMNNIKESVENFNISKQIFNRIGYLENINQVNRFLAKVYAATGQNEKANELIESILNQINKDDSPDEYFRWLLLSIRVKICIDPDITVKLRKLKELTINDYGEDSFEFIQAESIEARYFDFLNDYTKANLLWRDVTGKIKKFIFRNFKLLAENQRLSFFLLINDISSQYYSFISKHLDKQDEIQNLIDYNLATKSIIFEFTKNQLFLESQNLDIQSTQIVKNLKKLKDSVSRQILISKYNNSISRSIDSILTAINYVEIDLIRKNKSFIQTHFIENLTFNDLKSSLNQNEQIVVLNRFKKDNICSENDSVFYLATIIVGKKDKMETVLVPNGVDLEGISYKKYNSLVLDLQKNQTNIAINYNEVNNLLKDSYIQYWSSISEKIDKGKKTFISLDGIYNKINLNTLIDPKSGRYVLEEQDIQIIPSLRDICSSKEDLNKSIRNTAVLFGDIKYNLDSTDNVYNEHRELTSAVRSLYIETTNDTTLRFGFNPLPYTKEELNNLSLIFKNVSWDVKEYSGKNASENVLKSMSCPKVLHIATHGFFGSRNNLESSGNVLNSNIIEHPYFNSYLAFAGAQNTILNNKTHTFNEDGLFTAYEAMNLDLNNCELVVLSACETGRGVVQNGDGVYGLQRSFMLAGAKNLLMSLWKIDDKTTKELMTEFYTNWITKKIEMRSSFKEAQKSLMIKYKNFFYWGAFVLIGR